MSKFIPTIGLEIHIELQTRTKMFCDSLNDPEEKHPNINVCPICMGHPGTLPVPNKKAIEYVILAGRALNCQIAEYSQFDRKNYFYPDLPKGYQISQFYYPLCRDGYLEIDGRQIRIKEIHLEEETGRLYHPQGVNYSLVDFNRAGIPLMELVTQPDISSGAEAKKFCEELQLAIRYLGISNADMERGEMRCEVNVSLSKSQKLGTKVEIKNLNSFKAVERAIIYEIKRQSDLLESGEKATQETRGWDDNKQNTFSQRSKETAKDYRYFPEPDIPALKIPPPFLTEMAGQANSFGFSYGKDGTGKFHIPNVPELPQQRRERFNREYRLPEKDIEVLVVNKNLGEYFEKVISEMKAWDKAIHRVKIENTIKHLSRLTKLTANYLITELRRLMRELGVENTGDIKITPENFAELIILIHNGEVSSSGAQQVLREMFKMGTDPSQIVEQKGIRQVSDSGELESIAISVIKNNPKALEDYKNGKEAALQFLVGQVMRETKGKANPQIAQEILTKMFR